MLEWADREQHRPDAKAQVLLNWLDAVCRPHGEWNNERVIVFTEYRDTQVWLHDLLSRRMSGIDSEDAAGVVAVEGEWRDQQRTDAG